MTAMNVIRLGISFFILVVMALSVTGWIWTGSHQPAAQSLASRVVLSLCVVAGVVGLAALWRVKPLKSGGREDARTGGRGDGGRASQ
jgi:hypothetical protein